ncbi:TniQ family protein [Nocardia neocaledoniensis]|uniref:TniQ family protein n=1 Tax=Nocardia neocaledoniensis TaxID=236511 RepID=UPI0033C38BF2
MSTPRWPLHPPPGELESLSSWVARLAELYRMPVVELVGPNLGVLGEIPDRLDEDAPLELLAALATATAVPVARLKAMTLPGWVPWLFDSYPMPAHQGEDTFYGYVRQYSVLLAPGEASRFEVTRRRTWRGPWIPETPMDRSCPLCTAGPTPIHCWVWALPLTIGCTIHRRRLLTRAELVTAELAGPGVAGAPVTEPVATLENYTHQALTTGAVRLPGRRVHAAVWFRLLRTLLDELSLSTSGLSRASARVLAQVWQSARLTPRAGIRIWAPYEQLGWTRQEDLLTAAAAALDLAAQHQLRPRGTLADALAPPRAEPVYPGEDARRTPDNAAVGARILDTRGLYRRADYSELFEELARAVRTDPETARRTLAFLARTDPSPANLDRERDILIRDTGMPPEFVRTRAETQALLILYGHDPGEIAAALTELGAQARSHGVDGAAAELFVPEDLARLRARLDQGTANGTDASLFHR